MPTLRRPNNTTRRELAGPGGNKPTPPPGPLCDTCSWPVSRYNPWGRCHACAQRVGYPEEKPQLDNHGAQPANRPIRAKGHAPGCECATRRRVKLVGGLPVMKKSGGYRFVIDLTCPTCEETRTVHYQTRHGHPCNHGYRWPCHPCSKIACASASKTRIRDAA